LQRARQVRRVGQSAEERRLQGRAGNPRAVSAAS
jgi:hypothetical protein